MILLLESLHPDAEALLQTAQAVTLVEDAGSALALVQHETVNAILTRGKGRIGAALIAACGGSLRAVSRAGAGVDTIDVAAARQRGVTVIYAPGINAASTAEHTFLLMLAITRRAYALAEQVKTGNWAVRDTYEGVELRGKTLGIVGMGAIGRQVAQRARAFGMRVMYANRGEQAVEGCEQLSLAALLPQADLVSLHVPLNDQTRGMLGAAEFQRMKPGAFLINAARGALVNKSALAAALHSGRLAGYAADVFDPQPPAAEDMALLCRPDVLLTPHVAAITDKTYRDVCLFCARNVLAVLRGDTPDAESVFA
jgi:D-3-phosphoglycerate dehydrogenase / 2-oxoglutarate reductase